MHRSMKKTLAAGAALAGLALAVPPAASAEANPYTGQQVCGSSSFRLYGDHPIWSHDRQVRMGRLLVLFSADQGRSCAVVLKTRRVGEPTYTSVSITPKRRTLAWRDDSGSFRYYAGPVYAPGPCVRAGGFLHFPNGREGLFVEGAFPAGC